MGKSYIEKIRNVIRIPATYSHKLAIDPIQAILASKGVEYTHENSEVIGSSKVEDELARQAELAA
ncbi:Uu.00g005810.m01.CDS01 [Anthostomella pinea]|uniref:Uu.00g005810.m01.CDS01 n=1 Tax=Anthostomella pinea TaxID=933095 RepID=A0AAI8YIU3_9PEZI|nr:Uu.00g005810.m01.CDS01 [Anthostomella pinea]